MIPFLLAPLITRIYTPADFAAYEIFANFLMVLVAICCLRYELAIILPKTTSESFGLIKLCFRILLIITGLSALVILPLRNWFGRVLENDALPQLLWWLPPTLFFTGAILILNSYMMRAGYYKTLASNKIIATTSTHGSRYLLGLSFPVPTGLVASYFLGSIIPLLSLLLRRNIRIIPLILNRTKIDLRALAIKYKEFPLVNGSHSFFDEGQKTLLIGVISIYYGEVTLGLFALTFRYLRIPVQVFGSSLSQVFHPKLAKEYNEGLPIRHQVKRVSQSIALIGVIPFTVLFFYGEPLFAFVFSEEWRESGHFAEIIAPWLFLSFISSPLSLLPTILSRQRSFFLISFIGSGGSLIAVGILAYSGYGFLTALWTMTAINGVMNLFLIFWFIEISGQINPALNK